MAAPTSTPTMRYLRGSTDAVNLPAASGQQINPGDLTLYMSGLAYPVSAYPCLSGNEIQNWSGARSEFAGVAISQRNSTDVRSGGVLVLLHGQFQYPFIGTSGTTLHAGTWVGFTQGTASGYFHPQQLMQSSGQATAIGKVCEDVTPVASGTGQMIVHLQSTLVDGVMAGV